MAVRKRLRRKDPARTAPLRDFSTLYRRPDRLKTGAAAANSPPPRETPTAAPNKGPLAEGVELAYQVIEKHIVDGRRTAEQFNKHSYGTRVGTDSVLDLLERMIRFQSEILPLWVEALGTIVKIDPSENGHSAVRGAAAFSRGAIPARVQGGYSWRGEGGAQAPDDRAGSPQAHLRAHLWHLWQLAR